MKKTWIIPSLCISYIVYVVVAVPFYAKAEANHSQVEGGGGCIGCHGEADFYVFKIPFVIDKRGDVIPTRPIDFWGDDRFYHTGHDPYTGGPVRPDTSQIGGNGFTGAVSGFQ